MSTLPEKKFTDEDSLNASVKIKFIVSKIPHSRRQNFTLDQDDRKSKNTRVGVYLVLILKQVVSVPFPRGWSQTPELFSIG